MSPPKWVRMRKKKGTVSMRSQREIKIHLPADVLLSMGMDEKQMAFEMRRLLAFKLFSERRLSGGKAAKLAGMSRIAFLLEASQRGIDLLPYSEDDVKKELA